ncbi:hypothetical protein V2S66_08390 [Streptomyces sp. V4-01]|uniref:DUF3558 domain-containing protein n=1 Tax=Actinacidiphila polyblastidii TaxID=3110430 RepID=A0ABU7P840_9ACTN|nr:hypothetical protein [Streptomyces sp. V4-01]
MRSTPRRLPVRAGAAVAAALAVTVLGAVSACTAGGGGSGTASDGKSLPAGATTPSPLPPGKYQTLPQPCTALQKNVLEHMVPGAKDYAGTESLTYDTDRRVGCAWRQTAPDGASHALSIDFERVVSYDPGVSDEVQAEQDFEQRAQAASISLTPLSGTPTGGATPTPTGTGAGAAGPDGGTGRPESPGATDGTGSGGSQNDADPSLAPRRLTDVGNVAFINDVASTPAAGPRRVVTVVFRTANVVVSVTYSASEPAGAATPNSADLQKDALQAAGQLERKVEK